MKYQVTSSSSFAPDERITLEYGKILFFSPTLAQACTAPFFSSPKLQIF
jgi:hypothetical protein